MASTLDLSARQYEVLRSISEGLPFTTSANLLKNIEERGLVVNLDGRWEATAAGVKALKKYEATAATAPANGKVPAAPRPERAPKATKPTVTVKAGKTQPTATVPAADAQTQVCQGACGQTLPLRKFPTLRDPSKRGTECRTCRDARRESGAFRTRACDARCQGSTRDECECECGGANHGMLHRGAAPSVAAAN
jgi:hypothetical protein